MQAKQSTLGIFGGCQSDRHIKRENINTACFFLWTMPQGNKRVYGGKFFKVPVNKCRKLVALVHRHSVTSTILQGQAHKGVLDNQEEANGGSS